MKNFLLNYFGLFIILGGVFDLLYLMITHTTTNDKLLIPLGLILIGLILFILLNKKVDGA